MGTVRLQKGVFHFLRPAMQINPWPELETRLPIQIQYRCRAAGLSTNRLEE